MRRARVVAGAISEGDPEGDEAGNAGSWLELVLMLEEVRESCFLYFPSCYKW
jgi:hypothetical protein